MLHIEEIIDNIEDAYLKISKTIKEMEFSKIEDCQTAVNILAKLSHSVIKIAIAKRNDPKGFEDEPQLVAVNTLKDVEFMRNLIDKEEARIKRKKERDLQRKNRKEALTHPDCDEDLSYQPPVFINEDEERHNAFASEAMDKVEDFLDDYLEKYGDAVDDEYIEEEKERQRLRAKRRSKQTEKLSEIKDVDVTIETVEGD